MDQFRLPEQHHVLLVLGGLLHLRGKHLSGLLLLNLEDFAKGPRAQFFHDLKSSIQDFLSLFQRCHGS